MPPRGQVQKSRLTTPCPEKSSSISSPLVAIQRNPRGSRASRRSAEPCHATFRAPRRTHAAGIGGMSTSRWPVIAGPRAPAEGPPPLVGPRRPRDGEEKGSGGRAGARGERPRRGVRSAPPAPVPGASEGPEFEKEFFG